MICVQTDGQTDGRTDRQTDGHGETSIHPYNFVAGGIKRVKMDITDKSSINHNNLGLLFVESLPTTSRSEDRLVGYLFFFFLFFPWVLIVDYTHVYIYSYFISIKIHNSVSFTHCRLQINHQMPLLRRHRQGSVGL